VLAAREAEEIAKVALHLQDLGDAHQALARMAAKVEHLRDDLLRQEDASFKLGQSKADDYRRLQESRRVELEVRDEHIASLWRQIVQLGGVPKLAPSDYVGKSDVILRHDSAVSLHANEVENGATYGHRVTMIIPLINAVCAYTLAAQLRSGSVCAWSHTLLAMGSATCATYALAAWPKSSVEGVLCTLLSTMGVTLIMWLLGEW
jgi:hypothetical protein